MLAAALIPDLTDILEDVESPDACVFNDLAEIFLLGTLDIPCDTGGPLDLLVSTLRPLRRPVATYSERVSAGILVLDKGLSPPTVMKPYRSTSSPCTSSQSSIPPASSNSLRRALPRGDGREVTESSDVGERYKARTLLRLSLGLGPLGDAQNTS